MPVVNTVNRKEWRRNLHRGTVSLVQRGNLSMTAPMASVETAILPNNDLNDLEFLNGRVWWRMDDGVGSNYFLAIAYFTDAPIDYVCRFFFHTVVAGGDDLVSMYLPNNVSTVNDISGSANHLPANEAQTNGMFANIVGDPDLDSRISFLSDETGTITGTVVTDYWIHLNFRALGDVLPLSNT